MTRRSRRRPRAGLADGPERRRRSPVGAFRRSRPDAVAPWEVRSVWPGGFIGRRGASWAGRAWAGRWCGCGPRFPSSRGPVGAASRFAGLLDIANRMTVRADPREVLFPNIDLTAHLFRRPEGAWAGFDITVTFGADGIGLTSSVLQRRDRAARDAGATPDPPPRRPWPRAPRSAWGVAEFRWAGAIRRCGWCCRR